MMHLYQLFLNLCTMLKALLCNTLYNPVTAVSSP